MTELFYNLNSLKIPDFWQIIASLIGSVIVVYLIEWFKQPKAKIELLPDMTLKDGRKFVKVRVKVSKNLFGKIFPWQNPASLGRLKGYLVDYIKDKEVILFSYTVKWDNNPEPIDYNLGKIKLELLPAVSAPENFLSGDEGSASVAVKHPGSASFYVYDGNYYVNQQVNERSEKKVILRLVFNSSSVSTKRDFMLINGNSKTSSFNLKEV